MTIHSTWLISVWMANNSLIIPKLLGFMKSLRLHWRQMKASSKENTKWLWMVKVSLTANQNSWNFSWILSMARHITIVKEKSILNGTNSRKSSDSRCRPFSGWLGTMWLVLNCWKKQESMQYWWDCFIRKKISSRLEVLNTLCHHHPKNQKKIRRMRRKMQRKEQRNENVFKYINFCVNQFKNWNIWVIHNRALIFLGQITKNVNMKNCS